MKQINAAYADRTDGVPVIGIDNGNKFCLIRVAIGSLLLVLEGDFDCDLSCGGTIVRVKYPG